MAGFTIRTLGCKVSQYDGERLGELLVSLGCRHADAGFDMFILNGCSVTARASQKARQLIRRIRRENPRVAIVLAGCEARLVTKRNEEIPEVDWVLVENSVEAVKEMLSALSLDVVAANVPASEIKHKTDKTRAYLKIQDGCTQFCTYCIVSRLRGPEWSRPIEDAVAEAKELVAEGHKEIVLTGIHIGRFKPSLLDLLHELEKVQGLERIRISSIEPTEVTEELITWLATSQKACGHLHLPLQSGCNKILRAMNRPYTTEDFLRVVKKVREILPDIAISTDLIVGFPGEGEGEFEATLDFLRLIDFSRIHIFRFSPRDGTPAATMAEQVPNGEKAERSGRVQEVWHQGALAYHRRFEGRELEVLWESWADGFALGTSREYISCKMAVAGGLGALDGVATRVVGVEAEAETLLVKSL